MCLRSPSGRDEGKSRKRARQAEPSGDATSEAKEQGAGSRGQWAVGSGQWAVGSGQWAVGTPAADGVPSEPMTASSLDHAVIQP